MSEPFLAEIRIVGFNFAPRGWAHCDGQILPINQNQSLFSLLGTTYGGDGQTSFALPELRGRTPVHFDGSHPMGQRAGAETVTLAATQMPVHGHVMSVSDQSGDAPIPNNNTLAAFQNAYRDPGSNTTLAPAAIANAGGGQAHNNMQPYLALNFVIALQGLFPSPN